jgi:Fe-S cluster assembly iron-binding protein IscA
MIHVTERAREMLKEALEEVVQGAHVTLRLGPTPSGLGLFPDTPRDDDEVVEHEGQAILVIDREVGEALADKTIDVEDSDDGSRFVVKRGEEGL